MSGDFEKMNEKNVSLRIVSALCLILCIVVCCSSEAASNKKTQTIQDYGEQSVLPKTGDIAVLVEGPDEHKSRVEANIIDILTSRGYRVVEEAKMKKIRAAAARAQAARYALYGEFDKILRINAGYSVAATIIATITPEETRENRIKLFTGTASVSIIGVKSNGVKLGGKTSVSKQIGYTQAEALRKAVDEAVQNGMQQLF